jgi:hypothetical protein
MGLLNVWLVIVRIAPNHRTTEAGWRIDHPHRCPGEAAVRGTGRHEHPGAPSSGQACDRHNDCEKSLSVCIWVTAQLGPVDAFASKTLTSHGPMTALRDLRRADLPDRT